MSGDKKAAGGGGPDLELKRAFGELQHKMVETQQRMKVSDLQIENLKRTITHSQLTAQEIGSLPDQTPVYESVGRMFLLAGPALTSRPSRRGLHLAQPSPENAFGGSRTSRGKGWWSGWSG